MAQAECSQVPVGLVELPASERGLTTCKALHTTVQCAGHIVKAACISLVYSSSAACANLPWVPWPLKPSNASLHVYQIVLPFACNFLLVLGQLQQCTDIWLD